MDDANLSLWFERSVTPAWGLSGGAAGLGPEVVIQGPDGVEERLLKVNAKPLKAGTIITVSSGGGGGFGPPNLRASDRVRGDADDRFISPAAASTTYGVTLS
jgi:N-methylhydantoinase B